MWQDFSWKKKPQQQRSCLLSSYSPCSSEWPVSGCSPTGRQCCWAPAHAQHQSQHPQGTACLHFSVQGASCCLFSCINWGSVCYDVNLGFSFTTWEDMTILRVHFQLLLHTAGFNIQLVPGSPQPLHRDCYLSCTKNSKHREGHGQTQKQNPRLCLPETAYSISSLKPKKRQMLSFTRA